MPEEMEIQRVRNVFITGALGFLGKFFVKGLLEQDPELNLYLLVREKGKESPEDRIRAAGLLLPNVSIVRGDVTDEDLVRRCCGMAGSAAVHAQDAHATLPPMDEFWHIAGLTVFHESKREQLIRVNVHGTANAIALAERLQCKRFFHISTAYVAGICDGPVMEDKLLPDPTFRNPYEETKYAGEKLVRASNLPWVVVRPSIIMGHSETGEADSDKMVYGVVRCYHSLASWVARDYRDRSGPPPDLRYYVKGAHETKKNYLCVDDCVRLMLAARGRAEAGKTYHACHSETVSVGLTFDTTCDLLDMDYVRLNPEHNGSGDPKQEFIDRGVRVYEPYMLRSDPVFDLTNAFSLDGWRPASMDRERIQLLIRAYTDNLD